MLPADAPAWRCRHSRRRAPPRPNPGSPRFLQGRLLPLLRPAGRHRARGPAGHPGERGLGVQARQGRRPPGPGVPAALPPALPRLPPCPSAPRLPLPPAQTVAAAGNDNLPAPLYPSAFRSPAVIAVASLDVNGRLSGYSSFGPNVHLAAPGSGVRPAPSTLQDGLQSPAACGRALGASSGGSSSSGRLAALAAAPGRASTGRLPSLPILTRPPAFWPPPGRRRPCPPGSRRSAAPGPPTTALRQHRDTRSSAAPRVRRQGGEAAAAAAGWLRLAARRDRKTSLPCPRPPLQWPRRT